MLGKRLPRLLIGAVLVPLLLSDAIANETDKTGPRWLTSYEDAIRQGKDQNKPIIVDMWAEWCVACKDLAHTTFVNPAVVPLFDGFVLTKVDMDAPVHAALWEKYAVSSLPQVFFLKPDGSTVPELTLSQFESAEAFAGRMRKARAAFSLPDLGNAPAPTAAPAVDPKQDRAATGPTQQPQSPTRLVHPGFAELPDSAVAQQPHVAARLLSNVTQVAPGSRFRVGVHLTLTPKWHVYWKYPGDAGLPTQIDIQLPDGFSKSHVWWPAPKRYAERGNLVTYGYADEVLFFVDVTAPSSFAAGSHIGIDAKVQWLVCENNCLPGRASLHLTLPTSDHETSGSLASVFADWEKQIPSPWTTIPGFQGRSNLRESVIVQGGTVSGTFELQAPSNTILKAHKDDHLPVFVPIAPPAIVTTKLDVAISGNIVRVDWEGDIRDQAPTSGTSKVGGVFRVISDEKEVLAEVSTDLTHAPATAAAGSAPTADGPEIRSISPPSPAPAEATSPWLMFLFAFLGGIILNIMPCVLPVLSIKAIGLVQQSGEDPKTIWYHGLAYWAGVMVSFWVLAAAVIGLKASGELVQWGSQFQNPWFVTTLAAIVFGFGLSLFGVFEVSMPGMQMAASATRVGGLGGSFFTGAFATLLGTPCTAPLLAPAMAFALSQDAPIIAVSFSLVGMGLALPFVILARFPKLVHRIPKRGPWLEHFKHIMGFLMMATAIWLLDVLAQQVTPRSFVLVVAFLGVLALASWIYGRFAGYAATRARQWTITLAALALIVVGARMTLILEPNSGTKPTSLTGGVTPEEITWRDFSPTVIASLQQQGQTVFIDFTAAWCITCKANENAVIDTGPVRTVMAELNVVPVKADFTNNDKNIADWLQRFNSPGVPLYIILPGSRPNEPIVLPQILTTDGLIEQLRAAGPSRSETQALRDGTDADRQPPG